jgi:NADPH:quinone reductase
MFALVFDQFGLADVLHWQEVPDPVATADQALVRLDAAGLNFADVYRRRGNYHLDSRPPWILGYEGSGTIVGFGGSDQGIFKPGDRVGFADAPKANAELVAVPLDKLVLLPTWIDSDQAAALLLQGLTAQYLCSDSFDLKAGQTAVVHAAAGGVGLLLTQMAVARGAAVIALASSEVKRQAARESGATHVIDPAVSWAAEVQKLTGGRGADVVFDSVGSTLGDSFAAARTGGAVVFYGFAGGDPAPVDPRLLMDRSLTLTGGDLWNVLTCAEERRARAAKLFGLVRDGQLAATIAARIPMAKGADAHRLLESRSVIGKVLLTLS